MCTVASGRWGRLRVRHPPFYLDGVLTHPKEIGDASLNRDLLPGGGYYVILLRLDQLME